MEDILLKLSDGKSTLVLIPFLKSVNLKIISPDGEINFKLDKVDIKILLKALEFSLSIIKRYDSV